MTKTPPKHMRIYDVLLHEIKAGKYNERERFPSEEMLVRRFNVSRPTIIRALQDLKRSGLLDAKAGSGTFLSTYARSSAGMLGMIMPDREWNFFFAALAANIRKEAKAHGYMVLSDDYSWSDDATRAAQMEELARDFAARRVRGVLLQPFDVYEKSHDATTRILEILSSVGIPVVLLDRDLVQEPRRSHFDLIESDNFQAGYRLAQHLLERGAHDIRFFSLPNSGCATQQRIHGAGQAVLDAGGKWSRKSVYEGNPQDHAFVRRIFNGRNRPDAIICRNDHIAAFLLQTLADLHISVPKDVKVAAFDDVELAEMLSPPLTSVRQPVKELASVAMETLLQRIERPAMPPRRITLDVEVIVRASTGTPA